MRRLVIERKRWARCNEKREFVTGRSSLLNENSGMCCLGFWCLQLGGLSEDDIQEKDRPSELDANDLSNIPYGSTDLETALIDVNDRTDEQIRMTDAEQEEEIRRLFAMAEVEAVFVD
jgi:hypothetical protein